MALLCYSSSVRVHSMCTNNEGFREDLMLTLILVFLLCTLCNKVCLSNKSQEKNWFMIILMGVHRCVYAL